MSKKIDHVAFGLKPSFTFKNLIVSPHNQFAAAACEAVSKSPGDKYNPLYVYGPPGIGKTHTVQAIAHAILENNPKSKVLYLSAERLISEIITAIADDNVMAVRQKFSQLDLLIIDDVQYLAESKATQEEFLHILNNMPSEVSQIVLAANQAPAKLKGFSQRLQSRFEGGLSTNIGVPNLEARIEILKIKQNAQELTLPDDMLLFAAQRLKSNVRELEGFLKRMHAYVHLSHQEVTSQLVQAVIQEILPDGADPVPDVLIRESDGLDAAGMPPPIFEKKSTPVPAEKVKPDPKIKEMPRAEASPPPEIEPVKGESPESEYLVEPELKIERYAGGEEPIVQKNGHSKNKPAPPPEISQEDIVKIEDSKPQDPLPSAEPVADPDSEVETEDEENSNPLPTGHKEIPAVFFFPKGQEAVLEKVQKKFTEVIKKHKLKFRLRSTDGEAYDLNGKIDYNFFVDVCKKNFAPVAIVIGPPPDVKMAEQDFYDLLSVTLDVQGISLQIVGWGETEKDYRYLNLSLDIALVRTR